MTRRVCPDCKGFMSSRARICPRCVTIAKNANKRSVSIERAKIRLRQRAERELTKIRDKAKREGWRLPRLQQAIDGLRKTRRMLPEDWDPVVRSVFGVPPGAIVDPRQMSLFADSSSVRKTA
jgi:hypothetical protein